jgi:hypothetical protein
MINQHRHQSNQDPLNYPIKLKGLQPIEPRQRRLRPVMN